MTASNQRSSLDVVHALCDALRAGDMRPALDLFSPDVHYHNMPWAPMTGARAVVDFLQPFVDGTHATLTSLRILHEVAAGEVVMNAREETWERRGLRVLLPVAGLFVVHEGRITRWCDYWDAATMKPILDALT
jgi:limonene-1,2-epoxide hydrolase